MSQAGTAKSNTRDKYKEPEATNQYILKKRLERCRTRLFRPASGSGGAGRLLHRSRFLLVLHRPQLIYRAHSGRDLNGSDWEYAEVQKTEVNELGSGGAVVRMRRVQVPEKRRQV
jgi:hypothetical protein